MKKILKILKKIKIYKVRKIIFLLIFIGVVVSIIGIFQFVKSADVVPCEFFDFGDPNNIPGNYDYCDIGGGGGGGNNIVRVIYTYILLDGNIVTSTNNYVKVIGNLNPPTSSNPMVSCGRGDTKCFISPFPILASTSTLNFSYEVNPNRPEDYVFSGWYCGSRALTSSCSIDVSASNNFYKSIGAVFKSSSRDLNVSLNPKVGLVIKTEGNDDSADINCGVNANVCSTTLKQNRYIKIFATSTNSGYIFQNWDCSGADCTPDNNYLEIFNSGGSDSINVKANFREFKVLPQILGKPESKLVYYSSSTSRAIMYVSWLRANNWNQPGYNYVVYRVASSSETKVFETSTQSFNKEKIYFYDNVPYNELKNGINYKVKIINNLGDAVSETSTLLAKFDIKYEITGYAWANIGHTIKDEITSYFRIYRISTSSGKNCDENSFPNFNIENNDITLTQSSTEIKINVTSFKNYTFDIYINENTCASSSNFSSVFSTTTNSNFKYTTTTLKSGKNYCFKVESENNTGSCQYYKTYFLDIRQPKASYKNYIGSWVKFNADAGDSVKYGTYISYETNNNYKIYGYAWSDKFGWLSFHETNTIPEFNFDQGKLFGKAKFLSFSNISSSSSWNGLINFSGRIKFESSTRLFSGLVPPNEYLPYPVLGRLSFCHPSSTYIYCVKANRIYEPPFIISATSTIFGNDAKITINWENPQEFGGLEIKYTSSTLNSCLNDRNNTCWTTIVVNDSSKYSEGIHSFEIRGLSASTTYHIFIRGYPKQ